jgi:hypothetical protein
MRQLDRHAAITQPARPGRYPVLRIGGTAQALSWALFRRDAGRPGYHILTSGISTTADPPCRFVSARIVSDEHGWSIDARAAHDEHMLNRQAVRLNLAALISLEIDPVKTRPLIRRAARSTPLSCHSYCTCYACPAPCIAAEREAAPV